MELSKEVINILEYLCDKFGIAVDWTDANVMPYLQELCTHYIQWEISTSIMWIVLGVLIVIGAIVCGIVAKKTDDEDFATLMIVSLFFLLFIAIAMFCVQTCDILKCRYFPELQVMEYLQRLMRNK